MIGTCPSSRAATSIASSGYAGRSGTPSTGFRTARQVQRRIGPAWDGRTRPAAGYFTKRTAEAWLRDVLDQARKGTLPGLVHTGVTFAEAADEWLRYVEHDRERKPSTVMGYRWLVGSQLLPTFGDQ